MRRFVLMICAAGNAAVKRLFVLALCLTPVLAQAQTQPVFTGPTGAPAVAGDPISLSQMRAFFGNKVDATGGSMQNGAFVGLGATQADSVGQMLSVTGSIPSPATFTTIYDPVRSIIGPFTKAMEFGGNIGLGNANALVGGIVCPSGILVGSGTYCGGVSGYAYNMSSAPVGGGAVATATGVAGYGGFGVTGGSAWGLVGFATNCMGSTCNTRTGFGGSSTSRAGLTSQELDLVTYLLPSGASPDYGAITGSYISGTADSQARWSRAHSSVYGLLLGVLDTNDYLNKQCLGDGLESNCWDAALAVADGASFVGLQLGAQEAGAGHTVPSQLLTFSAYNAGVGVLADAFVNPSGQFLLQAEATGSVALAAAGTVLLQVSNPAPAAGTTSLTMWVNSPTAGLGSVPVTMAAENSGGTGFRNLVIPN